MTNAVHIAQHIAVGGGYLLVWVLCLIGLIMSAISFSGTWVVTGAAVLAMWLSGPEFPGWGVVLLFLVLSIFGEVIEAIAGAWGVSRRGGSKWAGFMAILGGLVGMVLGAFIPVPVIGSLIGMLVGSFVFVFLVERHRLKKDTHAAHIAMGAVIARVMVVFVKTALTLGMIVILIVGMAI